MQALLLESNKNTGCNKNRGEVFLEIRLLKHSFNVCGNGPKTQNERRPSHDRTAVGVRFRRPRSGAPTVSSRVCCAMSRIHRSRETRRVVTRVTLVFRGAGSKFAVFAGAWSWSWFGRIFSERASLLRPSLYFSLMCLIC